MFTPSSRSILYPRRLPPPGVPSAAVRGRDRGMPLGRPRSAPATTWRWSSSASARSMGPIRRFARASRSRRSTEAARRLRHGSFRRCCCADRRGAPPGPPAPSATPAGQRTSQHVPPQHSLRAFNRATADRESNLELGPDGHNRPQRERWPGASPSPAPSMSPGLDHSDRIRPAPAADR